MPSYAQISVLEEWHKRGDRFRKAEQHVLRPYFAAFFDEQWDIFHYEKSNRDFFLVPCSQALSFFAKISSETGFTKNLLNLENRHVQFRINPEDPYDPPVFIGRSACKADFERLVAEYGWANEERAVRDKPQQKKKKQAKQKAKRHLAEASWRAQVRCARQYLGLGLQEHVDPKEPPMVREEDEQPVMFVSVDVEAYEMDHSCITEIGISSLDTLDIAVPAHKFVPYSDPKMPQTYAAYLISLIRSKHLRVQEYRSLRNGTFVRDAADHFEFGTSEFVPLADVPATVAQSFRCFATDGSRRKIVLVGHDIRQDMSYLRKVGYDVWTNKDLEVLDTVQMFKAISEDPENRSLSRVLTHFNVVFWNLHNAGNDAAYTLQAFCLMACTGTKFIDFWMPQSQKSEPEYDDLVEQGCIKYIEPMKPLTIEAYADKQPTPEEAKKAAAAAMIKTGWESDDEALTKKIDGLNVKEDLIDVEANGW